MCCDRIASETGGGAAAALPGLGAEGCSLASRPAGGSDRPSAGAVDLNRDLPGMSRGFPRHTLEEKVMQAAAKPLLRYPVRLVEEALQAPGGRRRRPSRAF